jgi:flagellar hook-associated protein 2
MAITVNSTTPSTGLLTSLGVGSGLDVATLVDQLVAARKAPRQNQITDQANSANTQLSALGQISAALSALQSAMASISDGSDFTAHSVTSGDADVLSATATGNAVAGSYKIEVTQLASALKASSGAFADSSAQVGTGTLTIAVGDQTMNLAIEDGDGRWRRFAMRSTRPATTPASAPPSSTAPMVRTWC